MNALSLFSGVGGLDLGLVQAGMTIVGQVEIDKYCQQVLAKHWLEAAQHDDVRSTVEWWHSEPRPRIDVVAGGPPCTPFSTAGRWRGTADERWGWPWMADVVRAVRPRYVLLENVPALVGDGEAFGWILGDLAEIGFNAEWTVFSACTLGAPHPRERLLLVAYAAGSGQPAWRDVGASPALLESGGRGSEQDRPWAGGPPVRGVAYGVPHGMDRRKALGNAVVPAVGEFAGRLIMEHATEVAA